MQSLILIDFLLFIVTLRLSLSLVWHMIILKGLAILCIQALYLPTASRVLLQ